MRLVVLGGSGSSTPELIDALEAWPSAGDRRPPIEVVLVARHAERLEAVAAACRARVSGNGPAIEVTTATDRRAAVEGADVVLEQVRIGGYAARSFDESFPHSFGIPGEETMGPGGFANACRTVPAVASTWADIAEVAPDALVVNLTNPAGIVQTAAHDAQPDLRVISVCDSPMPMLDKVAERLGRPRADVWRRYVGMNHLGWYVPESADELHAIADLATGLGPEIVELHGALPAPYVRYYVTPDRILESQRGKPTRAETLMDLERKLLDGYRAGDADLPRRGAVVWYRMAVVVLVDAWLNGSTDPVIAAVRNAGRVRYLPDDAVIEVVHEAPAPRVLNPIEPVTPPALPSALLAHHAWYEVLAARGAASGDAAERLRALEANPLVTSHDQATELLRCIEEGPKE